MKMCLLSVNILNDIKYSQRIYHLNMILKISLSSTVCVLYRFFKLIWEDYGYGVSRYANVVCDSEEVCVHLDDGCRVRLGVD